MTDRKARDEMAKAIRTYMGEEITAFQFDDALSEAMSATEDETVRGIGHALWFHYDDCKDHKIVASKEAWDYFNRLLLLLESDGEIEIIKSRRRWRPRQAVAAIFLGMFLFIAFGLGFGAHLLAFALPFGPVSILLSWFDSRRRAKAPAADEIGLTPFPSVGSLLSARRKVASFVKVRYPSSIAGRRVRDPIIARLMWVPWAVMWCMFSPVALFFQMLPERESKTRIRMPEDPACAEALPRAAQA